MNNYIFDICHTINDSLSNGQENEARENLIKLLDYHKANDVSYSPLINHLIRETGLFPYLESETANWAERFVFEAFKVDVGEPEPITLHREQSLLLKKLLEGQSIAVSAPTSFGKSFVIDAFIKIQKPKNVLIIVPTIALTDETRRRLYKKFADEYKIITTSDVELCAKNIFIFPQERAIGYTDLIESIDILIVDEFYKASNDFDKERSASLIKAMIKLGDKANQKYYLAPNISTVNKNPFTRDMEFIRLNFNTVFLEITDLSANIENDAQKGEILLSILSKKKTKSLIYAGTYSNINSISTLLLTSQREEQNQLLSQFSKWLGDNYSYNWGLTKLVMRGTGVHNGRLHRSLSQIQVKLFEETEGLNQLISTSSIIEGVNTSAENVIIWRNRNGSSKLDDFTYKNIMGRGGRMFKYFVGKIFILDTPPKSELTQLNISFPDEILGDIDEVKYQQVLTQEQIVKIKAYEEEMSRLLGYEVYHRLKANSAFQSSNSELIKSIAIDMSANPNEWNGLNFLNTNNPNQWDRLLYKIIRQQPSGWDTRYSSFVAFVKIISQNWTRDIPDLLKDLDDYNIGVDEFFQLERNVTFKFASLLKDVNTLQKEILKDKRYDISRFVAAISSAFLPTVVFQLEEYGLPRMISKKIHASKLIDFTSDTYTIHSILDKLNQIGLEKVCEIEGLDDFDRYILRYFFKGITIGS